MADGMSGVPDLAQLPETLPENIPDKIDLSISAFTKAVVYTEYYKSKNSTNNRLRCNYFKIGEVNGQTWTCPKGYYCFTKETEDNPKVKCPKGFLCPENSQQPTYCCAGWYCPDASEAFECPKGSWCPRGSVKPQTCFGLTECPPRTDKSPKYGLLIIFLAFFVLIALFFAYRNRKKRIRNAKYNNLLQHMMDEKDERPEAVEINRKKYDIEFEDLGLVLPSKVEIMRGVSGEFKSGRTCCIMGPSGAGKTTFVNLLTEKVRRTTGTIKINGKKDSLKRYKKLIGFVPQEDVMLRELTVQDILLHSAFMRLPTSWTREQKKEKVLEVIHFLELDNVMNSNIGNEEERGISGGQRKRVNIGMELVADPSVLFLDEPTSGLDSTTAYEVCALLSEIAKKQNMTIISVIHSPSAQTFRQFDDLLLLGKGGRTVYFGPVDKATQYFERIGFPCPPNENPADFFMDVTSGKVPSSLKADFKPSDLFDYWALYNANKDDESFRIFISSRTKYDLFKKTHLPKSASEIKVNPLHAFFDIFRDIYDYFADLFEEIWNNICGFFRFIYMSILSLINCCIKTKQKVEFDPVRDTPNVLTVFWLDLKRACLQIYRNLRTFFLDQVLHLGCGIFISIASQDFTYLPQQPKELCNVAPLNLRNACLEPIDYITFAGIFVSLGILFAGMSVGSGTFGNEKVVFWRDSSAGQPTISYYVAKVVADIPRIIIAAVMFTTAFILLFPYHSSFKYIFYIDLALYACAFSMGYFLSVIFDKKIVALASTGFSLAWALVFSGIIPNLTSIPSSAILKPIKFLWDCSAPRWAIELFWLVEVHARDFEITTYPNTYKPETWPVGFLYIFYITIGWNVLAYLAMKLLHRQKQK
jgi:ABC-type multidrug transport system ATPase subunit